MIMKIQYGYKTVLRLYYMLLCFLTEILLFNDCFKRNDSCNNFPERYSYTDEFSRICNRR